MLPCILKQFFLLRIFSQQMFLHRNGLAANGSGLPAENSWRKSQRLLIITALNLP
jgi:hypothetical protein